MFAEFFAAREWATWAWAGIAIIAAGTYGMVHLDVWINEWFGENRAMPLKRERVGDPVWARAVAVFNRLVRKEAGVFRL